LPSNSTVHSRCRIAVIRGDAGGRVASADRCAATAAAWRPSVARLCSIRAWLRSQARCAASVAECGDERVAPRTRAPRPRAICHHELVTGRLLTRTCRAPRAPPLGYPPVDLDADYVIGPYTAAFAEMTAQGSTTERLISWRLKDSIPGLIQIACLDDGRRMRRHVARSASLGQDHTTPQSSLVHTTLSHDDPVHLATDVDSFRRRSVAVIGAVIPLRCLVIATDQASSCHDPVENTGSLPSIRERSREGLHGRNEPSHSILERRVGLPSGRAEGLRRPRLGSSTYIARSVSASASLRPRCITGSCAAR
jgi:hypothetical protein